MAFTGQVSVAVDIRDITASDVGTYRNAVAQSLINTFVDGTGLGAINAVWQDIRPLTDGGNEALDVSPTPSNGLGLAVTFARLKAVLIWAPNTNTTNLTITGTVLYAVTGDALRALKPGGMFLITDPSAAGMTVTGGTVDLITVTNSAGAAATYGVILAGALS